MLTLALSATLFLGPADEALGCHAAVSMIGMVQQHSLGRAAAQVWHRMMSSRCEPAVAVALGGAHV
jgi:pentatricopeptide repeat protein